IPRTLHMSLAGIRDLSIINTPPRNRLPIETHLYEYHEEIIKTAIENELERGGQVYVVHNRISNLAVLQEMIEAAVPKARTIVGHGQMDEEELEAIMKEFIAGNFDVLISTTIIENGLDISNVNTIIVNRADTLGLSQLYQLRGRVGRSSEQAYAYFLVNSFKNINESALKRLRALQQYTELGSGFQIAMRDLEIRGAGNILGVAQHGAIAVVGFELYSRLLKEEIDRVLGKEAPPMEKELKLEIALSAFIPSEYIPDSATRISLYQECSSCRSLDELSQIRHNFLDRFGPLPQPLENLLTLLHIKVSGYEGNCSLIRLTVDGQLHLSFHGTDDEVSQTVKKLLSSSKRRFEIQYGPAVILKTNLAGKSVLEKVDEISRIMDVFNKIMKNEIKTEA
ncbi:MAG: transcription-repair coupling factor, partial [Chitinivibrionales bacterium]|nr:transcription-repair coupling factor [Chitinivibrionales bacterium]